MIQTAAFSAWHVQYRYSIGCRRPRAVPRSARGLRLGAATAAEMQQQAQLAAQGARDIGQVNGGQAFGRQPERAGY